MPSFRRFQDGGIEQLNDRNGHLCDLEVGGNEIFAYCRGILGILCVFLT